MRAEGTAAGTAGAQAQALNWGAKTIMLVGGVAVALAMMAITPVLPQIEAALAHTPGDRLMVKLLVTVIGVSMVVGAPLAGFLTDRIGMRNVLLAACGVYCIAGTAGLYLDNLPALMVSRLFLGAAAAAIATTSMTLINSRLEGVARAKWMGAHVGTASLAGLVLNPAAGLLGELGWRWPFALFALGLPLAAVVLMGVDGAHGRARPAGAERTREPRAGVFSWFPGRWAALALIIGSITYLPMVYLPFVVRQTGVISPTAISLVMLADTLLAAGMALLFGRSQRYFSSTGAFVFSFACAAAGLSTVALAHSFAGVVGGMIAFGLGLGWFVPNLMTAAARNVPADRQGRTVGVVKGAHYLAAPACTILVEPLTRQFGPESAMLAAATLALCLVLTFSYGFVAGRIRSIGRPVAGRV